MRQIPAWLGVAAALVSLPALSLSGRAAAAASAADTPERSPVLKAVEPNGLRLLAKANPSSDIVAIDCLVRVGLRDETEQQAGIAALVGEVASRGTERHPAAQMPAALAAVGGSLEVTPGFDFTEFTLSTTRDRFPQALSLLAEVLGTATMEPSAIEAGKTALKQRLDGLDDDLTASSYQALLLELYPTAAYGRPVDGYPISLDRIDRKQLTTFYHDHYVQNNMVIAVAGNIDPQTATAQPRRAFGQIPFHAQPLPPPAPADGGATRPRVTMRRRSVPAAQVMFGGLAPPTTTDTYPTWMVLDAMMGGGKGARLFRNLREKDGIGYVLGSFYQPLLGPSHMVAYVVTDAYKADPKAPVPEMALDVVRNRILEQFQSLADQGPTDSELQRAKSYAIGSFARQHERNRDQAHWLVWMEAMGMGYGFDRELPDKIATVTKEQIQQASKECLSNYALVVTIPNPDSGSETP